MRQLGVFDVTGPVMIGPSSSHTAGAARLGLLAGYLCGEPISKAVFYMHGSFADTYAGHGTDKALVAGILGIAYGDRRLRDAFRIAESRGLEVRIETADLGNVHPNTVKLELLTKSGRLFTMTGSSVGGGCISLTQIDGIDVNFSGEAPILATLHKDEPGVIAGITALLYTYHINIGNMQVSRREENGEACMYMELAGKLPEELSEELNRIDGIKRVMLLDQVKISAYEEECHV